MTGRQITCIALLASGALLAIAEVNALSNREGGDTISERINEMGRSQPLATIAVGACAVHFAGGVPPLQRLLSRRPLVALGLGGLIGAGWPLKGMEIS